MPKLLKSGGLLSIAVLGSGNVVGTVISAIALIIFSRYLGPTEFGLFSAAFAAMQIMVRLADLGVNMAAERAIARSSADTLRADRLIRLALWLKGLVYLTLGCFGWFLAPWLSHSLLHFPDVTLLRLSLLLSAGTVFFEYTTLVYQATQRFGMVARITIAQALGKLLFGLLFIWQGVLTATTAIILYGLMPGIGSLLAWIKRPLSSLSLPSRWQSDLTQIVQVAKWTGVAAIAATLADNIDVLMVQSFLSAYDTGIWSGAVRIASFASLVGWSIGAVLNIRVARYHNPAHLRAYLQKAWKIALFAFIGLLLATPFAGFAIWATIGSAYQAATVPLQILLVAAGLAAATSPYVALFYLIDRPQYYALAGIISTLTLLLGDLWFIPQFGLLGAAGVRVVVRFAVLIFTLIYAKKSLQKHYAV